MAEVLVTEELPVPATKIWELVRDFGGIQKWVGPMIQNLEIEGEGVGAIRTLTLPGDTKLSEELKAFDNEGRSFSYAIIGKSPLPVADYLSTDAVRIAFADGGFLRRFLESSTPCFALVNSSRKG